MHVFPRFLGWGLLPAILLASGCPRVIEDEDDDTADDDDSGASGDDDSADDDDSAWEGDPPVFLARYDFTMVTRKNSLTDRFEAVHGEMDVLLSETAFQAILTVPDGTTRDWRGTNLENQLGFHVRGMTSVPGYPGDVLVEVQGGFLADTGGGTSTSCLAGIGTQDDPRLANSDDFEFAWYACRLDAEPASIDRTGTYSPVAAVLWDNCAGAFDGAWSDAFAFPSGRKMAVTRSTGAGVAAGWGVLSDDGQVFRYTVLLGGNPGLAYSVIGDFTNPTQTTEGLGFGFCGEGSMSPDTRHNLDY